MVDILTPKQRSALNRALKHPELLPRLYRKVEELKWFDVFYDAGLLDPTCNPSPMPAKDEGYFQIPVWPITEYLVKTSAFLKESENSEYAIKYRNLLRGVTEFAKKEDYGNYRTWWQFSKIIKNIPVEFLEEQDIELVRYWISDKYERGIIGETLGDWLLELFEIHNEHASNISLKLLDSLYQYTFEQKQVAQTDKKKAVLLFNSYKLDKYTEQISRKAGKELGIIAVDIFKNKLIDILGHQENDKWSAVWRPAIEEHSQNMRNDDADDIVLKGLREAVLGLFESDVNAANSYLSNLFNSELQTIVRIAIYTVNQMFPVLTNDLSSKAINSIYFESNYRHEVWNLLENRFVDFTNIQKEKTFEIIDNITLYDEDDDLSIERNAYQKSIWLSAISDKDEVAMHKYNACVEITNTNPEHPDFSSYMSTGWGGSKSPIELETLRTLGYESLVTTLNEYKGGSGFKEPGIEGLTKSFKELVKLDAEKLYLELDKFVELDVPYIQPLLESFLELWEKGNEINLPWDTVWPKLLNYIYTSIQKENFWKWPKSRADGAFVANHHWVVGTIGRLIEAGCKSDEHAFDVKNIELSKSILSDLLDKESGEIFKFDSDAVSIAINSSRGRCLEALINLALFTSRNFENIGVSKSQAWEKYKNIFDLELNKPSSGEYEFATLVANYLHNFIYMSEEWTISNLPTIFDQSDHQRWLCAMQGYSYVNELYPVIYNYLRENGDLVKVLDEENLKDRVDDRYLQFITLAYLHDDENITDPNSQISILLKRAKQNELRQLIWFLWTFRDNIDEKLRTKVYQLWPILLNLIDESTKEGKVIASQLCHLSVYVDHLDEERMGWLMKIAPYAEVDHNSHDLLEVLAKLSANYPFEVKDIWMAMLTEYSYDYPEEVIKEILRNIVKAGKPGVKAAKEIVGAYFQHGVERPIDWLDEIIKDI